MIVIQLNATGLKEIEFLIFIKIFYTKFFNDQKFCFPSAKTNSIKIKSNVTVTLIQPISTMT